MHKLAFAVLAGFIVTAPLQQIAAFPGAALLIKLVGLVVVVVGILSLIKEGRFNFRQPSLMLGLMVLLALWAVVSNLWSLEPDDALLRSFTFVQLAVLVWLIWQLCRSEREHLALLQAFVLGTYALGGTVLYGFITNPWVPNSQEALMRYSGIGTDTSVNETSAMLALAMPIAWYLTIVGKRGLLYWLNFLYLPLALLAIGLTASRGGFLVAVVGLAFIPFTYSYLNRWRKLVVPILLGTALVVAFNTIPQENFRRLAETSSELTEGEVSNRTDIWEAGLEVFRQHPLLGVGVGNYATAIEPLLGYRKPSHNAFLAMLVDLGLVGLVLFMLILVVTFLPLFSLRAPHRAFYLVLGAAIIVSMLPLNAENDRWLWILLALITTRKAFVLALPSVVTVKPPLSPRYAPPLRVKTPRPSPYRGRVVTARAKALPAKYRPLGTVEVSETVRKPERRQRPSVRIFRG